MPAANQLANIRSVSWIYELYRLGSAAARERSTETYDKILRHIVAGFSATSGCLALRDDDSDVLTIVAGIDLPPKTIGSRVTFGEGVLGYVAAEGEPLLLNGDIASDERWSRRPRELGGTPGSAMCWPLIVEERVIGVLSVNNSADSAFEPQHLRQGGFAIDLVSVVIENTALHAKQQALIQQLQDAQAQLLQSEKMASVGQLAAGIAHEINNPIGYVNSNLGSLQKYVENILAVVAAYERLESRLADDPMVRSVRDLKAELDLEFVKQDTVTLLKESREGIERVRKIVQDLKDFSHVDATEWQFANLHAGLDSTLNIAHNGIKYKATVIKEYGDLPPVECLPSQLNQVFMNMLVNAAQAIDERGTITLRTGAADREVWVEIIDTGAGIPAQDLKRIFDPFFTTKPVGQGTGLGLSLSYSIVQKHKGRIEVWSSPGKGTTFRIWLPIKRVDDAQETAA